MRHIISTGENNAQVSVSLVVYFCPFAGCFDKPAKDAVAFPGALN